MGEKEMFLTSVYQELQDYRKNVLKMDKEDIYNSAYQITAYANIFNSIVDMVDENPGLDFGSLLNSGNGVLEYIYQTWLNEDGTYSTLGHFVVREMCKYRNNKNDQGISLRVA